MMNQSTVDKLIHMRMKPMADAYILQENDPSMREVDFDDRFGMLIDVMYNKRQTSKVKHLVKEARLDLPEASIMEIDYHSGRELDKKVITYLANCEYISDALNIFITGAAGCGKTYMACAFAMEAIKQYISTRYVLLPDLLMELDTAKEERRYAKVLDIYTKPKLLIIDEWLAEVPSPDDQHSIKTLLSARRNRGSTIFCSQYLKEGWYQQLGGDGSTEADAILDRIVHDAYEINISYKDPEHSRSMREVYSKRKVIV